VKKGRKERKCSTERVGEMKRRLKTRLKRRIKRTKGKVIPLSVRGHIVDGLVVFGPGDNDTLWALTDAYNKLLAIAPDGAVPTVVGAPDEMALAGGGAEVYDAP
jgi:hypothetical protein